MAMGSSSSSSIVDCFQPSDYIDNADDCDDNEPLAWSGAEEVYMVLTRLRREILMIR